MSIRAGLRNPITRPTESRPESAQEKPRTHSRGESADDPEISDSEGSEYDGRVSAVPLFDAARVLKKRNTALANRKDIKLAMRQFKDLLKKPGSRTSLRRVRYGIMVSTAGDMELSRSAVMPRINNPSNDLGGS